MTTQLNVEHEPIHEIPDKPVQTVGRPGIEITDYAPPEPGANLPPTPQSNPQGPTFMPGNPATGGTGPAYTGAMTPAQFMEWQSQMQQYNPEAATREVQDRELMSHQMNQLLGADSRYLDRARAQASEAAAARGMMGSSYAAGAAERSAIDAAAPIAQFDASAFGQAARDNQAFENQARFMSADAAFRMIGQEFDARFRSGEAERDRIFQSGETAQDRLFRATQSDIDRGFQAGESFADRDFRAQEARLERAHQQSQAYLDRDWRSIEAGLDRDFQSYQALLDRTWRGEQADRDRLEQRVRDYQNYLFGQQGLYAQAMTAIYSNPNLTPEQQRMAAANAHAFYQRMFEDYARTMAQGVPEIFWDPYPMQDGQSVPSPSPQPFPFTPNDGESPNPPVERDADGNIIYKGPTP
jgi:hypothetical protein